MFLVCGVWAAFFVNYWLILLFNGLVQVEILFRRRCHFVKNQFFLQFGFWINSWLPKEKDHSWSIICDIISSRNSLLFFHLLMPLKMGCPLSFLKFVFDVVLFDQIIPQLCWWTFLDRWCLWLNAYSFYFLIMCSILFLLSLSSALY